MNTLIPHPITHAERYLSAKELAAELYTRHGITMTAQYVREIRKHTLRTGERVFLRKQARLSDLVAWIRANPQFRRPRHALGYNHNGDVPGIG